MENKCVAIEVRGRVQGVAFRHHTKKKADSLGISGWVRNMPDGSVYIEACGNQDTLEQFIKWCHRGPILANVLEVIIKNLDPKEFIGFVIRG